MSETKNVTMFRRKRSYDEKAIDDIQRLVKASRELEKSILTIPHEESIICYYGCMPFVTISESSWDRFSEAYKKYFPEGYSFEKINSDYRAFLLNDENNWKNLSDVLDAVWKGMPRDVEKHTQHLIACNHQTFEGNKYSVCGVETCIPSAFMSNGHKPEVDFVAFCPDKKEMLLIEYKCKYGSLYPSKGSGIREHWIDYTQIKRKAEKPKKSDLFLVREMLNAYNLLREINGKKPSGVNPEDVKLKVAFLLTGNNYKYEVGCKGNITKKANDSAIKKVLDMEELKPGDLFTDKERNELLWGWSDTFENVDFNECFKEAKTLMP